MEKACKYLFAGPRLTQDEHRHVAPRDARTFFVELLGCGVERLSGDGRRFCRFGSGRPVRQRHQLQGGAQKWGAEGQEAWVF